jgi:flagellar hook assembly protein FlgD
MIRVWVDRFTSGQDKVVGLERLTARNYPNPFNPETQILFNMPKKGNVSIQVFNIKGQLVKNLLNEERNAGQNTVRWNGQDNNGRAVSSGVYFYRVQAENQTVINKMLLMK